MMRKVSVIIKSSRIANKRLCTLLYSQLSRYEADMKEKKTCLNSDETTDGRDWEQAVVKSH